jgi:2-keto-3-deoxy-L-rhamnonate aldolase RhmA
MILWQGRDLMKPNRVKQLYQAGKPAFGTYITFSTPAVVELAGQAGLDFVRIDTYHRPFNPETVVDMVTAAYAHEITPWIRCRLDPWVIMMALDAGAQAISISNIPNAEAARRAVAATYYPPKGEREAGRPLRFRSMGAKQYHEWAENEVILSVQIEGVEGLENYREIVKVDGIDCIQSGRGDISLALGYPGDPFHPKVLEAEERVVEAALEAGKQVSLQHGATEDNFERMVKWMERGVRIFTVDQDFGALLRSYKYWVDRLRAATPSD